MRVLRVEDGLSGGLHVIGPLPRGMSEKELVVKVALSSENARDKHHRPLQFGTSLLL
tara:strand:- start:186 stop:356 length:171 start_codon:yes stop_codon:yes gene_type:complete